VKHIPRGVAPGKRTLWVQFHTRRDTEWRTLRHLIYETSGLLGEWEQEYLVEFWAEPRLSRELSRDIGARLESHYKAGGMALAAGCKTGQAVEALPRPTDQAGAP
jgi:hypothetical protein